VQCEKLFKIITSVFFKLTDEDGSTKEKVDRQSLDVNQLGGVGTLAPIDDAAGHH
jgi:hypothetical protein